MGRRGAHLLVKGSERVVESPKGADRVGVHEMILCPRVERCTRQPKRVADVHVGEDDALCKGRLGTSALGLRPRGSHLLCTVRAPRAPLCATLPRRRPPRPQRDLRHSGTAHRLERGRRERFSSARACADCPHDRRDHGVHWDPQGTAPQARAGSPRRGTACTWFALTGVEF